MKMQTVDNIFVQATKLSDDEFGVLLSAMMREQKQRDCKKQKEAWARVREAITHYTANFGNIRIADFCGDENVEINLYHGQFDFSEYGDIEVGA